jgi:uroporphyrinogen decarboxylase
MTSRNLVKRTLEFDHPRRVPRHKWILPWAEAHYPAEVQLLQERFADDIVNAPAVYKNPLPVKGDRYMTGTYIDEWGCTFENVERGIIGMVKRPLVADWSDLARFRPPAATLDLDRQEIDRFCRASDQFVLAGTVVRPFERLGFIRTLEQALIDLLEQPPELPALLHQIHDHYLKEVEAWARTGVDAVSLMDDWGSQHGPMINPDLWQQIFKPMYRDYAEVARHYGKYVFMHSDGYITDIIPGLIEVGVQALNSQVFCMGVEELGRRFAGQITFWGEIDRQQLLAYGTAGEVAAAVTRVKENLWRGGGAIAQCEFGPGARPENIFTVFETWKALDV